MTWDDLTEDNAAGLLYTIWGEYRLIYTKEGKFGAIPFPQCKCGGLSLRDFAEFKDDMNYLMNGCIIGYVTELNWILPIPQEETHEVPF